MTVISTSPVSKWHPRRAWIGYAIFVSRFTMPLAKFFYGETHKWFFRTAAAVLVASYVAAVQVTFDQSDWWKCYLIAFGIISFVYWALYAPAKWSEKDNLINPSNISSFPMPTALRGEVLIRIDDEMLRSIIFRRNDQLSTNLPAEIEVLANYVHCEGRCQRKGPYLSTRQWSPPYYWGGNTEYRLLGSYVESIDFEVVGTRVFDYFESLQRDWPRVVRLLEFAIFLDGINPNWRQKAVRWSKGGYWGISKSWVSKSLRNLLGIQSHRDERHPLLKSRETP